MKYLLALICILSSYSASAITHQLPLVGADIHTEKEMKIKSGARGLVVIFLSSKCPCSNSHIPELMALKAEFPEFNFVGINSNTDETWATAKSYFASKAVDFPVLRDKDVLLANAFKALKTPHAYILNPQGEVLYQGGVSDSPEFDSESKRYLREALLQLEKGEELKHAKTRTLGCVISRSL